jgi:hypothetical protein
MVENIFENDLFIIYDTKQDYDFRYSIANKSDKKINLYLNGLDDYLEINGNDWVGLFSGDYSDNMVNCLMEEDYDYNYIVGCE